MEEKKMKAQTKAIVASVVVIALALSAVSGITYSWFSDIEEANVQVTTGKVDVKYKASVISETFAYGSCEMKDGDDGSIVIKISNMVAGDRLVFNLEAFNYSTIEIKYRTGIQVEGSNKFTISAGSDESSMEIASVSFSDWTLADAVQQETKLDEGSKYVAIEIDKNVGSFNDDTDCAIIFVIHAVQANATDDNHTYVATFEDLKSKLKDSTLSTQDNVINIMDDIELKEGDKWDPAYVNGNNGAKTITINGNGHKITGLDAPLFSGGFAGTQTGIIIRDLTIEDAKMKSDPKNNDYKDTGFGAFIAKVDSLKTIILDNCKLVNSTISAEGNLRVGGLIGWTSGHQDVRTIVTITNCTVEGCNISSSDKVAGGIIGHAGSNPNTYHMIDGCVVKNTTINGTEKGAIVGTANTGQLTITDCKQVDKNDEEVSTYPIYGRLALGDTGKLIIDGVEYKE